MTTISSTQGDGVDERRAHLRDHVADGRGLVARGDDEADDPVALGRHQRVEAPVVPVVGVPPGSSPSTSDGGAGRARARA